MDSILLWASQQLAGFVFSAALQPVAELLGDVTKGTSEKILSEWFKDTLKANLRLPPLKVRVSSSCCSVPMASI